MTFLLHMRSRVSAVKKQVDPMEDRPLRVLPQWEGVPGLGS